MSNLMKHLGVRVTWESLISHLKEVTNRRKEYTGLLGRRGPSFMITGGKSTQVYRVERPFIYDEPVVGKLRNED